MTVASSAGDLQSPIHKLNEHTHTHRQFILIMTKAIYQEQSKSAEGRIQYTTSF